MAKKGGSRPEPAPEPAQRVKVLTAFEPGELESKINHYLDAGGWTVHSFSTAYGGIQTRHVSPYSMPIRHHLVTFSALLVWDARSHDE